jgi:hypothetical protein
MKALHSLRRILPPRSNLATAFRRKASAEAGRIPILPRAEEPKPLPLFTNAEESQIPAAELRKISFGVFVHRMTEDMSGYLAPEVIRPIIQRHALQHSEEQQDIVNNFRWTICLFYDKHPIVAVAATRSHCYHKALEKRASREHAGSHDLEAAQQLHKLRREDHSECCALHSPKLISDDSVAHHAGLCASQYRATSSPTPSRRGHSPPRRSEAV